MPVSNPQQTAALLDVYKNDALVASRPAISFKEGAGITETLTDDAVNLRASLTIASSESGTSLAGSLPNGVLSSAGAGCIPAEVAFAQGTTYTVSSVWPSANRALYVPVQVLKQITVYKMSIFNGSAVAGNFDLGLYDEAGTRLVSSGSTVQAGTNVPQVVDVADTVLTPGTYWLAAASNSGSGQYFRASATSVGLNLAGMREQASAFPLPATATFSAVSANYLPSFNAIFQSASF